MTALEILEIITTMAGGLALFLFGMGTMSDSLGKMTGGVLGRVSDFIAGNRLAAFLFGTGITAIVQSSSAVTVLTVGLVNAGVIELEKAVSLLIGSNLGTTVTSWVLSLNAVSGQSVLLTLIKPSSFSPFLAVFGVGLYMFAKSRKAKTIGAAILGFSVMMIGMNMMSLGVSPLKNMPVLKKMLVSFSNPILGFAFALVFTMLIQSSDAMIGIVQAFALTVGVSFGSAIPLVCGANVGTCITALLSALGASNNGKRTAFINLYYNLLVVLPFMVVFYTLNAFFHFGFLTSSVGAVGIPLIHTLINLIGSVIWLPGAGIIVALARKTIHLSQEEREEKENRLIILDPILLTKPVFALEQTEQAVNLLAETVSSAFDLFIRDFEAQDSTIRSLCRKAEMYKNQIADYLTDISSKNILDTDAPYHMLLVNVSTALGRLGSVTMQALEIKNEIRAEQAEFLEGMRQESLVIGQAINEIIGMTVAGFQGRESTLYATIQIYYEEIVRLTALMIMSHVEEMHRRGFNPAEKSRFSELLHTEERLIDCCDIIAEALKDYASETGTRKEFTALQYQERQKQVRALFRDKYEMLGFEAE